MTKRPDCSDVEWQTRVDLAACYRLMAHYRMTDLIYNHITARVPGTDNEILINPYGFLYEEITASSFHKIDLDGNMLTQGANDGAINHAGYVIHSAVHAARHDVQCVIHTHTRAGMAVSAMKCGLLPLNQTAMLFHGATSYHAFEGPAVELDERPRLVADLGENYVMILHNHGLLACGRTIGEAFTFIHFLEKACGAQVDTLAVGREIVLPSAAVADKTGAVMRSAGIGALEWKALRRLADRIDPSYAS